ncbi:DUF2255 family protein [Streptomyces violaceus]|uniref:DUF2255 family protein n=1 Tax=Streptomyces violaceus TaxID=1936 RepID=UPI0037FEC390
MTDWNGPDLEKIAAAEELELASERSDGTLRDPVTMWVVRSGDQLYVRSVKGPDGPWYRGTKSRHRGRIEAGGVRQDVTFHPGSPASTWAWMPPTGRSTGAARASSGTS